MRYSDAGRPAESKIGEKTRKVANDKRIDTSASSGLAVLEGVLEVPYALDTGADRSVISQGVVNQLREAKVFVKTKLGNLITLVLGDNSEVKVNELVQLNVRFMTKRSQVTLKDIEFRVIPGDAAEILIGKSEIQRLGLPSIESLLDDVAVKLEEEKATEGCTKKVPEITSETLDVDKLNSSGIVVNPVVMEATIKGGVRNKEGRFGLTKSVTSRDVKTAGVKDLRQPKIAISEERRAEVMKKHKERVIELRHQEAIPLYVEKEQEAQMVKHELVT